jgi:Tfp pilus assembly protein PilO
VAELETQVRTAKLAARPDEAGEKLRVAQLFELTKAMPGHDDVPGIILELNSIAEATGVRFKAIAPQNPVSQEGYRALPITLTFVGNYYDLTDFLFRVRNLVSVRDGKLAASGRFLTLDTLDMHDAGLPQIEAVLTISAYVYDPNSHSTVPVAPVSGTTVATTTAPTTTTTPGVP